MPLIDTNDRDRVRDLNDAFRTGRNPTLGRMMLTAGINALSNDVRELAIGKTVAFEAFTPDNDPHGEHDFGSFDIVGRKFFWKIDYYDRALEFESNDPADPAITTRVLTIMLAEEY